MNSDLEKMLRPKSDTELIAVIREYREEYTEEARGVARQLLRDRGFTESDIVEHKASTVNDAVNAADQSQLVPSDLYGTRSPGRYSPGIQNMIHGAGWLVLGLIVTGATYAIAPGGYYIITSGAIFFGGLHRDS